MIAVLCVVVTVFSATARAEDGVATLLHQMEVLKQLLTTFKVTHKQCNQEVSCPYPYTKVLDECFYVSSRKLSWSAARQYCQGMAGDLATPKHVFAFLTFVLNTKGAESYIWLGANDTAVEGQWSWLDGREIDTNTWIRGQPNNNLGNENCMDLRPKLFPPLNDFVCNQQLHFACQYKA